MNPQQPNQPPSRPGSEYEFFMNPEKPPKRSRLSGFGGGNSMAMRIGVVAVIAFGVLIILYFVLSLFGGSSNKPALTTVVQDQNELIRVATLATTTGVSQSSQTTQNFALNANLSLTTEQLQLLAYMTTHGGKPNPKLLAATKDTTTDTALNSAIAASNFDSTFTGIMQVHLTSYQTALKAAFASGSSATEQQLLTNDYQAATLLLDQLGSPDQ